MSSTYNVQFARGVRTGYGWDTDEFWAILFDDTNTAIFDVDDATVNDVIANSGGGGALGECAGTGYARKHMTANVVQDLGGIDGSVCDAAALVYPGADFGNVTACLIVRVVAGDETDDAANEPFALLTSASASFSTSGTQLTVSFPNHVADLRRPLIPGG